MTTFKASGLGYDTRTRGWTELVEYVARDRMEAIRWCAFNREWLKNLQVIEQTGGH